jgi:hypothetical protein
MKISSIHSGRRSATPTEVIASVARKIASHAAG